MACGIAAGKLAERICTLDGTRAAGAAAAAVPQPPPADDSCCCSACSSQYDDESSSLSSGGTSSSYSSYSDTDDSNECGRGVSGNSDPRRRRHRSLHPHPHDHHHHQRRSSASSTSTSGCVTAPSDTSRHHYPHRPHASTGCSEPRAPTTAAAPRHAPLPPSDPTLRTALTPTTPDGWRLHLHRVVRASTLAAPARSFPVVLCPGLASGGVESYDLDPSASLAQHLADAGYDVW